MSEEMKVAYASIDTMVNWAWADNAKLHRGDLITESIAAHGFNDPIEVGVWKEGDEMRQMIVVGHGRLERLFVLRAEGKPTPDRIQVGEGKNETGLPVWLAPYVHIPFEDRNGAILYALRHNRSNSSQLNQADYNVGKLRQVLAGFAQQKLMGFDETDFAQPGFSGTPTAPIQMPVLPAFDVSKLPDAPDKVESAPPSYTLMITLPTYADLKETLRVLTCGQRKTLADDARMAAMDGMAWLARWRELLVEDRQQVIASASPVGELTIDELVVHEAKPVSSATVGGWESNGIPAKAVSDAVEPVAASKKKEAPKFKGGLCTLCGGAGKTFTNQGAQPCPQCNGAGDEESYNRGTQSTLGI